jgi:two-component system phosphate regulon sensor histidine kinase PhoR
MSSRSYPKTRLSSRFLAYYAASFLLLIFVGLIVYQGSRAALVAEVDDSLAIAARLGWESLPEEDSGYSDWAEAVFEASGFRVTLISTDGVVLADSHSDPSVMENHANRPEVMAAMEGEVGEAQRTSESTGFEQRYVAVPPREGLIVRTSVPTRVIDDELSVIRRSILIAGTMLGLIGAVVVAYLARRMARPITELTEQALAIAGEQADASPHRSRVRELDELGLAISTMGQRLRSRVSDAEQATATLEVVLGALPQGTVLFGDDERVLYANPAAYSILGSLPDQLSGLAPLQLQNAVRDARRTRQQETRALDHGSPPRRLRGVATPFAGDDRVLLLLVDVRARAWDLDPP